MRSPSTPTASKPPELSAATKTQRAELRSQFKQRRDALSCEQRYSANQHIADYLSQLDELNGADCIAAFAGTISEVDLTPWITEHLSAGGRIALPRVGFGGQMTFHDHRLEIPLEPNRFGILEPSAASPHLSPSDIQAVLVPLVAFDRDGHRLGMGGGYYDRFLPNLGGQVPIIGVAFACQLSAHPLPSESWDVPLHCAVTEQGVHRWMPNN